MIDAAYLEIQREGLSPEICEQGSPADNTSLSACTECLELHDAPRDGGVAFIAKALEYCSTEPAIPNTTAYTIPSSWLTKSTALVTTTFLGVEINGASTLMTLTVVTEIDVTRSDWTGFKSRYFIADRATGLMNLFFKSYQHYIILAQSSSSERGNVTSSSLDIQETSNSGIVFPRTPTITKILIITFIDIF